MCNVRRFLHLRRVRDRCRAKADKAARVGVLTAELCVGNQFFNVRDLQGLREVVVLAGVRNLQDVRETRDAVHIQPAPIAPVLLPVQGWVRDQDWRLRLLLAASLQGVLRRRVVRDSAPTARGPKKGR